MTANMFACRNSWTQAPKDMLQALHSDVDNFLLELDTCFGVAELLDTDTTLSDVRSAQSGQQAFTHLTQADISREAAAASTAAARYRLSAGQAAQAAQRARQDMQSCRAASKEAAWCAPGHVTDDRAKMTSMRAKVHTHMDYVLPRPV